jgi:hypothetical protein
VELIIALGNKSPAQPLIILDGSEVGIPFMNSVSGRETASFLLVNSDIALNKSKAVATI